MKTCLQLSLLLDPGLFLDAHVVRVAKNIRNHVGDLHGPNYYLNFIVLNFPNLTVMAVISPLCCHLAQELVLSLSNDVEGIISHGCIIWEKIIRLRNMQSINSLIQYQVQHLCVYNIMSLFPALKDISSHNLYRNDFRDYFICFKSLH